MAKLDLYFNSNISQLRQEEIKQILDSILKTLKSYFEIEQVDIYFAYVETMHDRRSLDAQTYESKVIFVKLFNNQFDKNEIMNVLFHELNHVKRDSLFSTEQNPTLFNWMLAEGLALSFEKQIAKDLNYDWNDFHPKSDCPKITLTQGLKEMIAIDQKNKYWNYYDWFNNSDKQADYPQDFGYKIGDFLVTEYCNFFKIKPHQAINISPEKFLKFAKKMI